MERSEPSLVPEWLRSNGSVHHSASSQADGPVLALPRRSRSSKSVGNTDSLHSPLLDRSISSNSRRSSNSNGQGHHDKNSYSRSYSSFSRSHRDRDRDRERSTIADNWDSEYSDPLRGMIGGSAEDPLRRSHSSNSRMQGEVPQRKTLADMKNDIHKNYDNGNGTHTTGNNVSGIRKVSFERDFPVLRIEDRPRTPDVVRVSSPGLSRAIQSLSIVNTPSVSSEIWTSALVDVPSGLESKSGAGSLPTVQPAATTSASSSNSVSDLASTLSGLKMAEALVQSPAQTQNNTQLQKEELTLAQSKKLIPMTSSKTLVRSSSDKLKPRTHMKSSDTTVTLKNGARHLSPLQLGSQPVRGSNVRGDGPKSPSSLGRLQILKPGRENSVSPSLKDLQSPTSIINNRVANGQFTSNPSTVSGPSKTSHNPTMLPVERKASDKRTSRSNFFKLVREKSLNNTSGPSDSGVSASSDRVDKLDKDSKELDCVQVTPAETGTGSKCSDGTCTAVDSFSPSLKIDNEEERAFLLSLGWEDRDEGDEEGLTEEEIYDCYIDIMKQRPTSRLCRVLQAKIFSNAGCSSSTEANTPASIEKTC